MDIATKILKERRKVNSSPPKEDGVSLTEDMVKKCNCKKVRKEVSILKQSISGLLSQLEKCEKCAYKQKVSLEKEETYEKVRLGYVEAFWGRKGDREG